MADMTPEERTKKLAELIIVGELAYDNSDPHTVIDRTIREAEDAAYERAAMAIKNTLVRKDITDALATEILALKSGDG